MLGFDDFLDRPLRLPGTKEYDYTKLQKQYKYCCIVFQSCNYCWDNPHAETYVAACDVSKYSRLYSWRTSAVIDYLKIIQPDLIRPACCDVLWHLTLQTKRPRIPCTWLSSTRGRTYLVRNREIAPDNFSWHMSHWRHWGWESIMARRVSGSGKTLIASNRNSVLVSYLF